MSSIALDLADASPAELVGAVQAIVSELAVRPAPQGVAAMQLAESLGRCIDVSEAALAPLVARVDATGAHGEGGFSSTGSWLRNTLGMRHGRAAERVTLARQLPRLPRVGKLLTGSALSFGYASAICHATPRLDDEQTAAAEDILLGMVEQGSPVAHVAKAADTITDLIAEQQGTDPEPEQSRRGFTRSWLVRTKSLDSGSWVKAWLNPEHTAIFDQIVGPLAKPRARGDDRDLAQRTADALMSVISEGNRNAGVTLIIDLAAYTAATGDTGPFGHTRRGPAGTGAPCSAPTREHAAAPPETSAQADTGTTAQTEPAVETEPTAETRPQAETGLQAETGSETETKSETVTEPNADTGPESGNELEAATGPEAETGGPVEAAAPAEPDAPGEVREPFPDLRKEALQGFIESAAFGRVPARLLDGTPISPHDARRIALNAGISGLVLGRHGLPLYLGRTVRFVTPAQRKPLLALYETCVVHGCHIPAHLCEVHHLGGGWKLGTPTDLDKLAPACGWHNRWIEEHGGRITETRDSRGRTVLKILPLWDTHRDTGTAHRSLDGTADDSRQPGAP
ncbi:DUF222 domain-containing protein [Actinomadura scrupuli]|uniref:DUF222 domain-containing protein n=1 Tax=Actinomadura scrupuli TaxID=559629 RepID=UPI003D996089